ncbi:methyltransferase domain protein [Cystoisospora suis]|uniref:Methyltransferase domain protein n=1 Tax=Cystoisospora suis TaxID=483139 RepID=A0A2C6KW85_9APIC|nr:methyltransferase domain protein [Cystoisospora suis]
MSDHLSSSSSSLPSSSSFSFDLFKKMKISTPDTSHVGWNRDFPDVYDPAEDTFLFLHALQEDFSFLLRSKPTLIVEIGCGSGCIVSFLQRLFFLYGDQIPLSPSLSSQQGEQRRESFKGKKKEEKETFHEEATKEERKRDPSSSSSSFFLPFFMAIDCNERAVQATIETVRKLDPLHEGTDRTPSSSSSCPKTNPSAESSYAMRHLDGEKRESHGKSDRPPPPRRRRRGRVDGIASDLFSCCRSKIGHALVEEEKKKEQIEDSSRFCVRKEEREEKEEEEGDERGEERPCERRRRDKGEDEEWNGSRVAMRIADSQDASGSHVSYRPRLEGAIDVVLFNPPYVPGNSCHASEEEREEEEEEGRRRRREERPRDPADWAWWGGADGREVIDRFLQQVPLLEKRNKIEEAVGYLTDQGFHATMIKRRKIHGGEDLSIWRFTRKNPSEEKEEKEKEEQALSLKPGE